MKLYPSYLKRKNDLVISSPVFSERLTIKPYDIISAKYGS